MLALSVPHLVFAAPGSLDPSFGSGGVVPSVVANTVGGLVVQPGGRIVVVIERAAGDEPAEALLVGFQSDGGTCFAELATRVGELRKSTRELLNDLR